jgi:hypothetical protein
MLTSVFQPFSSRGTFQNLLSVWRNLDTQNSTNLWILREPSYELAEPLGSAEPRLKNTDVDSCSMIPPPHSLFPYKLKIQDWMLFC